MTMIILKKILEALWGFRLGRRIGLMGSELVFIIASMIEEPTEEEVK